MNWLNWLKPRKRRTKATLEDGALRTATVRAVAEERINEVLAGAAGGPVWLAFLAVIELEVQEGLERCLDEKLTEGQIRWRLGGVEQLLALKQGLVEREAEARRKENERMREGENE